MPYESTSTSTLWPLLVYLGVLLALAATLTGLSYVIGERHTAPDKDDPFESGIASVGDARIRFSAKFYLVAMFFLIFDLEAVFIFTWAIAFRQAGWAGYIEIMIFIGVLLAALGYLWRVGALSWAPEATASVRQRGGED